MSKIRIDRDFSKNRSDRYQHLLVESSCSPEILTEFSDARGIAGQLSMSSTYSEELFQLRDELHEELWHLMKEVLTERQLQVIELTAEGLTQIEIAKILGVNQSSVTKSINGNCDYKNGKRVYGGARKKLQKAAKESKKIQEILAKMADLIDDSF